MWAFITIDADYFEQVLKFMYTRKIVVSIDNIEYVLKAANALLVDDLMNVCNEFHERQFGKGRL